MTLLDLFGEGPHRGFIAASYILTALVCLGLAAWVAIDHRRQRRLLADLEAQGLTRRSQRRTGETP